MNNYILSIDPSIKDTGFVLWEKSEKYYWKPIWVGNYNFKKYSDGDWYYNYASKINDIVGGKHSKLSYALEDIDIFIERGTYKAKNGKGAESLGLLRGFITGLFYKFMTPTTHPNNFISPTQWRSWYKKHWYPREAVEYDLYEKGKIFKNNKKRKWDKINSLIISNNLIKQNNWNIDIQDNHNIAEALLIGWYVMNNWRTKRKS